MPPPTPPIPQTAQSYYAYNSASWETQRQTKIDNTKTGLLLLMIGALINWIPFVGIVGSLLVLVGAIFVIIGRNPFGHHHDRNVIWSIIIFVIGIAIAIIGAIISVFSSIASSINNPGARPSFGLLFIPILIGTWISGIAYVLFTYALQNNSGRTLLWTAYASSIVLSMVNLLLVVPLFAGTSGSVLFSPGLFLVSGVLGVIPAVMYGAAFYLARERIIRREIPAPIAQQSATTTPSSIPPGP
jgi:hypothetical protein